METNNTENISLPWYKVWIDALFRPSVAVYQTFLQDIHATPKRAYTWLIICGLINGVVSAFVQPPQRISIVIVAGAPLHAIAAVLLVILVAGLIQLLAQALGGTGTYSKLVYALGTFNAPTTIISSLLLVIPYGLWINAAFGVYWAILSAIAVKVVHQFGWRKTIVATSPVIILAILLIAVTPWLIKFTTSLQ
jgi:hypothetical protein